MSNFTKKKGGIYCKMLTPDKLELNTASGTKLPNIITQQSVSKPVENNEPSHHPMSNVSSVRSIDNYTDIIEILQLIAQLSEKMKTFVTTTTLTEKYDELYTHIQNVTVANAKLEARVEELEKKNGG